MNPPHLQNNPLNSFTGPPFIHLMLPMEEAAAKKVGSICMLQLRGAGTPVLTKIYWPYYAAIKGAVKEYLKNLE